MAGLWPGSTLSSFLATYYVDIEGTVDGWMDGKDCMIS